MDKEKMARSNEAQKNEVVRMLHLQGLVTWQLKRS